MGDNRHVVGINGEALHADGAGVDEAKAVRLPCGEFKLGDTCVVGAGRRVPSGDSRAVEVHLTVDERVIGVDDAVGAGSEHLLDNIPVRRMIPICDGGSAGVVETEGERGSRGRKTNRSA